MKRYTAILIIINVMISIYTLTDTIDRRSNSVSIDAYKKLDTDFNIVVAQFDTAIELGHKACQQRNGYKRQLDSINITLDFYKRVCTDLMMNKSKLIYKKN